MKEVFLGEVIRQRRLELGLTQEELCEGICEPMTISRFENGRQTPSRNRIKALLQRLGLPDDRFFGLLKKYRSAILKMKSSVVMYDLNVQPQTKKTKFEKIHLPSTNNLKV